MRIKLFYIVTFRWSNFFFFLNCSNLSFNRLRHLHIKNGAYKSLERLCRRVQSKITLLLWWWSMVIIFFYFANCINSPIKVKNITYVMWNHFWNYSFNGSSNDGTIFEVSMSCLQEEKKTNSASKDLMNYSKYQLQMLSRMDFKWNSNGVENTRNKKHK